MFMKFYCENQKLFSLQELIAVCLIRLLILEKECFVLFDFCLNSVILSLYFLFNSALREIEKYFLGF